MDGIIKIPWKAGGGNIVITAKGGEVEISSDSSFIESRTQTIVFRTSVGDARAVLKVSQIPLESCFSTGHWDDKKKWIMVTKWKN